MASMTMTVPPQPYGPGPFLYYTPNSKADSRSHALFSPHPRGASTNATPHVPSRPQTTYQALADPRHPPLHSPKRLMPPTPSFTRPLAQGTTVASPRPVSQKPTIVIQREAGSRASLRRVGGPDGDFYLSPSTPPLSVSGSAIGSPLSAGGPLMTPHDSAVFSRADFVDDVKPDFDDYASTLASNAHLSWSFSPPLTPNWVHPASAAPSHVSDLLSAQACPSLSPSPSPLSGLPQVEYNLTNPRHLSVPPSLPLDFPLLPTLCAGDDEEHKLILGDEPPPMLPPEDVTTTTSTTMTTAATATHLSAAPVHHGLPTFDDLSELDASEDDLVSGFATFAPTVNAHFVGAKRQRTDLVSVEDQSSFTGDLESDLIEGSYAPATFTLPTPPDSDASRRGSEYSCQSQSTSRSASMTSMASSIEMGVVEHDSLEGGAYPSAPVSYRSFSVSAASTQASDADDLPAPTVDAEQHSSDEATPPRAPVSRRGRKQSLTEDPSKTFVCDLCSRRFRRQEHLKRHYRSLHTHEKPFECGECGKKFSRSDNLAQHARTHGSGAIVMGVLEQGEIPMDATVLAGHGMHDGGAEGIQMLESRLYEVACRGSTPMPTDLDPRTGGTPSNDLSSRRKRRRVD